MVLADVLIFQSQAVGLHPGYESILETDSFWTGLLGGFLYGGVNEEVLMRLFLVSVLIWAISRIFGRQAAENKSLRFAAVIAAALIFGLAHLPLTSTMVSIDVIVVTRALVLNGIIGIAAGLIYLRYGFEAAVLTHALSHIPIQIGGGVLV
nr:CPBP family glutamic-type intramembrane protease [Roseibium litorale]